VILQLADVHLNICQFLKEFQHLLHNCTSACKESHMNAAALLYADNKGALVYENKAQAIGPRPEIPLSDDYISCSVETSFESQWRTRCMGGGRATVRKVGFNVENQEWVVQACPQQYPAFSTPSLFN
jgi:hypothetical protein